MGKMTMTFTTDNNPKRPTKKLFQHIKRKEWDRARFRALTYPWDAHFSLGNNVTPMHMVCLYRAPIDVVEILLDANPSALFAQDSEGWTPIHLVLLYGGDEDVALMLIRRGGAPAASLQSPVVGSPLHLACRHNVSIRILEELIKANLAMATTANIYGTKPAEVVWHQFMRNPSNESLVRILQRVNAEVTQSSSSGPNHPSLDDLLQRLTLLLQAAKQEKIHCDSMLIHELLSHQVELGDLTGFLQIAVQLFPGQVKICDTSGNYLLHIAASNPNSPQANNNRRNLWGVTKDPIDILLLSFPTAASFINNIGELPLHLALRKGKRTWEKGVSSLVEAHSDALHFRDRATKLYPFQLAAAYPSGEDLESLATIFKLLVAAPHVLKP